MQAENLVRSGAGGNGGSSTNGGNNAGTGNIFSIGHHSGSSASIYNYSSTSSPLATPMTPSSLSVNSKNLSSSQFINTNGAAATTTTNSTTATTNATTTTMTQNQNQYVEIQAQFELSCELRKFINIDLFQRGYYQIRLAIKCGNKQVPIKVIVQLENTQSNNNLSGNFYFILFAFLNWLFVR